MIGFDRPLKPEWIYETLRMVKVGNNPSEYNKPFEDVAKELVGKEGKRKVRTVLFRSFIYSFQKQRDVIENNLFIEWAKQYSCDFLRPLFLAKILMDYEVTRFITNKIALSIDNSNHLASGILTKKMVQEYGDRDVVRRSVRSFLKTLVYFNVLQELNPQNYILLKKFSLKDEQAKNLLLIYGENFLHSKLIDLAAIESSVTYFFNEIDFVQVARRYHGSDWEFMREVNRNRVLVK